MDSSPHEPACQYALLVPAQNVKAVKTFLEEHRLLDKSRKISPYIQPSSDFAPEPGKHFTIPLISNGADGLDLETHLGTPASALKSQIGPDAYESISIIHLTGTPSPKPSTGGNPLRAAFHAALSALPPDSLAPLHLSPTQLAADLPATYSIYPPLLLLPAHVFHGPTWTAYLASHPPSSPTTQTLLSHVAHTLHITHIATNAPIAPHNTPSPPSSDTTTTTASDPNILRSPTHLAPLYGHFPPRLPPSSTAFASALWVHTRQNTIAQTWAPAYTMFSRGNVKEKARILAHPTVRTAAAQPCTAVDLYAGIGYFAFSYKAAGVARVLGWEINPWSVEGMRRGAGANGWSVGDGVEGVESGKEVVVFREGNERAAERVEGLRGVLPPVRHVNGGLLPSSRGAWETAVRVVDPGLGGWVHLHENFGAGEVRARAEEVVGVVRGVWEKVRGERGGGGDGGVRLEHVERVKTYAPGVLHCVLDIWVGPTNPSA